ncbi:MAG: NAD-dependent epimerase/dehydratase family protein [Pseudomonadota bacterium]
MKTVLVTGGAGFVGKHLVSHLVSEGARVRVLDLRSPDTMDGVDWIVGSVTDHDPDLWRRCLDGVDTVYHLAGIADLWRPDEGAFEAVNVGGTETVLEAAVRTNVRRFVQCSSLTTLVSRDAPIGHSRADEKVVLPPSDLLGPYPASKRAADLLVLEAAEAGLNASIAMPTEPIGAGDTSLTPPTRMILDFANGQTPAFIDCVLNFVPVEDLARGFVAVGESGRNGERYLLGGENVSMSELLSTLDGLVSRAMPKTRLPFAVAYAAGVLDTHLVARLTQKPPKAPLTGVRLAGRQVSFSSEKAKRDLRWEAGPFAPALRNLLDWAKSHGHLKD